MERTVTSLAAAVALFVAIVVPAGYYALTCGFLYATLETETDINARIVSEVVTENPELWQFELQKLDAILQRPAIDGTPEIRRALDADGKLVLEHTTELSAPQVAMRAPIMDAGRKVGEVEFVRSLQPVLVKTGLVAIMGMALGAIVFFGLRTLPLRALRTTTRALLAERDRAHVIQRENDAAQAATQAKSQFLATMSHEIRTPMNGVLGMLELVLDSDLNEQQRRHALTAQKSADNLLSIINDVLDLSKIEAGKIDFETVEFDAIRLFEDVAELMATRAHAKGLELTCRIGDDVPSSLLGDAVRVRQVVTNLVGNAIKFTEAGEVDMIIDVAPAPHDDAAADYCLLCVAVKDSGIGIAEQSLEHLFQAFSQADSSMTRRFGGTGLGLAISKQLVEAMNGRIDVLSTPGKGSTFSFSVPLKLGSSAPISLTPRADLSGLRALIAEDNATNRSIIEHQLKPLQLNLTVTTNGDEALRCLKQAAADGKPIELAIIDMKMPRMDGIELAHAIKADPALAGLRVVMLTSVSSSGEGRAARAAGIAAYLNKPIRRADLHQTLSEVMGHDELSSPKQPRETPGSQRLQLAVLLAEDNPINQTVAQSMLRLFGCQVTIANNGREALAALGNFTFDLILMDCQMPEMDGFEATAAIRAAESAAGNGRRVPIIALTANAMRGDRERCLAIGMDDYLTKPFTKPILRGMLEKWSRAATSAARVTTETA